MGDMADDLDGRFDDPAAIYIDVTDDQWVTKDGQVLDIPDIKTSHLVNILNYVLREDRLEAVGSMRWRNLLAAAKKRGIRRARGVRGVYFLGAHAS